MRSFFLLVIIPIFAFSLTLEEALSLARKRVSELKINELELKRAEYELKRTLSGILPQIRASYSYTRLDDNLVFGFGIRDREEFLLSLTQVVFNKVVFESIRLSRVQRDLRKLVLEDVRREITYRTKEMFYALLYKREVVRLAQDTLRYWEQNLKEVEEKYRAGIIPKVELLRARAQYENAKADYEEKRADYLKSLEDFKAFLRTDDLSEPEGELRKQPLSLSEEEILRLFEENNSTLKVARKNLEVVSRTLKVVEGEYYPALELFLNYQGFTGRRTLFGGREWITGYSVGFRLTYNIFDGFSREVRRIQVKVDLRKEKERLLEEEYRLRAQLKKVLLDITSLNQRIRATELSLEAARESLRLSTERYRHGIATQLEILDARNNYNSTLERLYFLLYRYNSLLALLERLIY
ncbi:MAG: TolC family protein [Aquificae bacterium]|nr:TolC family protein [Aquificota bacterium]